MDVQTQAWTNSLLQVPKPQSNLTLIFQAASHKQRSDIAGLAPHVGKKWTARCTNVACASTPPEAELHKLRVLHSARTVHGHKTESGKDFLAYGCANTNLDKLPFALAKNNNVNTLSPSQLLATNKAATRRSFGLWMCKRKLEQIPFCTCRNPNPNTLSSSKLLATKKRHCSISSAHGQKLVSLVH